MGILTAMAWILFLALFPMSFFWLRRAWRILIRRDFSEVALRGGEPPRNPARFAPAAGLLNLAAGAIVTVVIGMVLIGGVPYEKWTAIAGTTIWLKLVADFIISRHAHPIRMGKAETPPKKGRG